MLVLIHLLLLVKEAALQTALSSGKGIWFPVYKTGHQET